MDNAVVRLEEAVRLLESCREFVVLIPEVRVNLVFAPENATGPDEVLGVDGRITAVAGMPRASGPIRPGASDHMARLIIETRKYDLAIRAGMNFRWNEAIHDHVKSYCAANSIGFGCIDRTHEPKELIGRDRSSIPWKVKRLVESCAGRIPPVFYESRGWGKEPLFFLVGPDPGSVVRRAIAIAESYVRPQN